MPAYHLISQDVLMCRDARPMTGSLSGRGANWPAPSVWFDAVHAALWRAFPEPAVGEELHPLARSGEYWESKEKRSQRFGALQTAGPFPVRAKEPGEERWLFPCPGDAVSDTNHVSGLGRLAPLADAGGISDLAVWLTRGSAKPWHPLGNPCHPSKEEPQPWWSKSAIETWLEGELPERGERFSAEDLFSPEWHTGIGMNPLTQTQDGERFYSGEALRLKEEVSLGVWAAWRQSDGSEGLEALWPKGNGTPIFGGQQRACYLRESSCASLEHGLPVGRPIERALVKWMLLSPAAFPSLKAGTPEGATAIPKHPGGWLPSWVHPQTRQVLLRAGELPREGYPSREAWRQAVSKLPPIEAWLVGARIPKALVLTGYSDTLRQWENRTPKRRADGKQDMKPGPKATHLAVPAGAVYYFEAGDETNAQLLADALNWHGRLQPGQSVTSIANRRSALLGEQGFGLGVCGSWSFGGE